MLHHEVFSTGMPLSKSAHKYKSYATRQPLITCSLLPVMWSRGMYVLHVLCMVPSADRPQTDQGSAETSHRTCSMKAPKDRAAFDIAKLKKDIICKRFQDTFDANIQNATFT